MNNLTILIPTYNRKERLHQTLKCLEGQNRKDFEVIISDNCSNYDINDIIKELDDEFKNRVKLIRKDYNIGSSANITMIFLEANTKWVWLLGDDDYPLPDAVEIIYSNMRDDIGAMHFSVLDFSRYFNKNIEVNDLNEFISIYEGWLHDKKPIVNIQGDLIFMSNKIYNLSIVRPYIECAIVYSYSKIGQLLPIFKMLEEHTGNFLISNEKIVESLIANNDHWDVSKILYGMTSFTHIPFVSLNKKQRTRLDDVVMFKYTYVMKNYILNNKSNWKYIDTLYHTVYKRILPFHNRIVYRTVASFMQIPVSRNIMNYMVKKIEAYRKK